MPTLPTALAQRAAINVLRDLAESHKMLSGEPLDDASVQLHFDAADIRHYGFLNNRRRETGLAECRRRLKVIP